MEGCIDEAHPASCRSLADAADRAGCWLALSALSCSATVLKMLFDSCVTGLQQDQWLSQQLVLAFNVRKVDSCARFNFKPADFSAELCRSFSETLAEL